MEVFYPGLKSAEILQMIKENLLNSGLEEHIALLNSTYCLSFWLTLYRLYPNLD